MLDIDKLRDEIDDIDKQIIELFEKRMDVVLNVAKYKMERNLPIFNGARENAVIEKNLKRLKNKDYSDYAEKFLNDMMTTSRELADFRFLAPVVLEQALKKAGTQLLEPYLSFTLFAPQEYLSRAYNDAPKYCAIIESTRLEKDEVIFKGEIPARCIGEYRNDLNFYTNGRSVCITELKGYQETSGEPVFQPRRPNSRLDKIRHMFQKIM